MLTFGSLFAGIGGFDIGLERAGMKCRWQVELNPYKRAVLAKHWPEVRRHNEVRTFPAVDGFDYSVDLICGGFPCVDITNAQTAQSGNKDTLKGLSGNESGLWYEFERVVGELLPRWVLVENSSALATRGLNKILHGLATLGFDADWATIPASALGAPHHRDRTYIVARRVVRFAHEMQPCECCDEEFCNECGHHWSECRHPGPHSWPELLENADGEGLEGHVRSLLAKPDNWRQDADAARSTRWGDAPGVRTVADGLSGRLAGRRETLSAIGDAVVPVAAEWIGRRIVEASRPE